MSQTKATMTDDAHDRWDDDEPRAYEDDDVSGGSLPVRPRRRVLTPATGALAAILVAAGGFYGGVQVQKHQGATGSTGGARTGARAGGFPGGGTGGPPSGTAATRGSTAGAAGAGATGAGAATSGVTTGTVSSKSGSVLYVKTSDGTVVRVKPSATTTVTRTATATAKGIYPGDTVVIRGTPANSGTVKATQITATSSTAASSGAVAGPASG
jgi:hypothetical protein